MKEFEKWFKKERVLDTLQGYEDSKAGWKAAMDRQTIFKLKVYIVTGISIFVAFLIYFLKN